MELILTVRKIEAGPGNSVTVTLSNSMGGYVMSGGGAVIEPEGEVTITGWVGKAVQIGDPFKIVVGPWTE